MSRAIENKYIAGRFSRLGFRRGIRRNAIRIIVGGGLLALIVIAVAIGSSSTQPTKPGTRQLVKSEMTAPSETQSQAISGAQVMTGGTPMQAQPTDNSNNQSSGSSANSNQTKVTINGQNVPVPDNGTIHRTITTPTSQSHVDISVNNSQNSQSGGSSSTSQTSVNVTTGSQSAGGP